MHRTTPPASCFLHLSPLCTSCLIVSCGHKSLLPREKRFDIVLHVSDAASWTQNRMIQGFDNQPFLSSLAAHLRQPAPLRSSTRTRFVSTMAPFTSETDRRGRKAAPTATARRGGRGLTARVAPTCQYARQ